MFFFVFLFADRLDEIQLKPNLEEIRSKYYRDVKKFISIPSQFRGLVLDKNGASRNAVNFSKILDDHVDLIANIYRAGEKLFQKLLTVGDDFKDWLVWSMSTTSITEFLSMKLKHVGDWESSFRLIKQKGREAEAIPSTVRADWVDVSLAPFKQAIDEALNRWYECLVATLRSSITDQIQVINDFINRGTLVLSKKPQSVDDIGEANKEHQNLGKEIEELRGEVQNINDKMRLLKQVAGISIGIDITALQTRWEKFQAILQGHQMIIQEQVQILKNAVEEKRNVFQSSLDRFQSRWQQLKPNPELAQDKDAAADGLRLLKEFKTEWAEIENELYVLTKEASYFEVLLPSFDTMVSLKMDLEAENSNWQFYERFAVGYDEISRNDWLGFRGRYQVQLEDWLRQWRDEVRMMVRNLGNFNSITAFVQERLDRIQAAVPVLKYVRGDQWASEHWVEMFRILGMDKTQKISISGLTIGQLLDRSEVMVKQVSVLQALNTRAQAEFSIRQALQEVEVWAAACRFTFTKYLLNTGEESSSERYVIKDWTDILTQLGDNRVLLQSVKGAKMDIKINHSNC